VNSSLSNGMFEGKRKKIADKVSEGAFVPKHTFDVFSKLISSEMSPNLSAWTPEDIVIHQDTLKIKLEKIKAQLL
jgi:hypothetical protein